MNGTTLARARQLFLQLGLPLCFAAAPAQALDAAVALADYHHDIWSAKDGAPQEVTSIAQTGDGWLWVGGVSGLYRFDGVRFKRYTTAPGEAAPRPAVTSLNALANGDLLVGHLAGGVSLVHQGRMRHYPAKVGNITIGTVSAALVDRDNVLWLVSSSGLLQLRDGAWRDVGAALGLPAGRVGKLLQDQYGRLWVTAGDQLLVRDGAGGAFRRVMGGAAAVNLGLAPDGRLWLDTHARLLQVAPQHSGGSLPRPPGPASAAGMESGLFDRDGNYWTLACPVGVCRYRAGELRPGMRLAAPRRAADRLDQPWQMGSLNGNVLFEDRDGSIWIGTQGGLERLRHNRLSAVALPHGERSLSIAGDAAGAIWLLAQPSGRLWRLLPNGQARLERTLAAPYAGMLASAADGALLIPGAHGIERHYQGRRSLIAFPPGSQDGAGGSTLVRLLDDGVNLWASIANKGAYRLRDGVWTHTSALGFPRGIFFAARAAPGAAWFGLREGTVLYYDNGQIRKYGAAQGLNVGAITFLHGGAEVLAGGDTGLAVLQQGRFRPLRALDADVLTSVSGMVVGANGDRWLNGSRGVVHVKAADWAAAMAAPELPLTYQLYGVLDGYPGLAATSGRQPTALAGPGGQLWFLGSAGVTRLDTGRAPTPPGPPQVKIESLTSQGRSYTVLPQQLALPAGTNAFRIEYTALSYLRPELLRFRYRLEGVDSTWQQPATQRGITYSNLGPGDYRFRISAMNEQGQWSAEQQLAVAIAPTLVQTWYFHAFCALLALALLYGAYLLRLRHLTLLIGERMAERARIARALHDTFLQSVHGLILNFHAAMSGLPRDSATRSKLERLVALADHVMAEGRDQVHDLRSAALIDGDLPRALSAVGALLQENYGSHACQFSVRNSGTPVVLQRANGIELYNIAREALLNAFRHAEASAIVVEIDYDAARLTLRVRDDGIGMPDCVPQQQQRAGHWGLPGMFERAAHIGATLTIDSSVGAGTSLAVVLPASLAYLKPPGRHRKAGALFRATISYKKR